MFEGKSIQNFIRLGILFFCLFFIACETQKKVEVVPAEVYAYSQKLKAADSLFAVGSYTCLKDAYGIYQELLAASFEREATAEKLIKTAILLTLRCKELGIIDAEYIQKADDLINNFPHLAEFKDYSKFAAAIPHTIKGVVLGFQTDEPSLGDYYDWLTSSAESLNKAFKANAETTEFHAYVYMSFIENFSYQIKEEYDFHHLEKLFPNSPMIKYRMALFDDWNKDKLEETLEAEPRFKEVHLFLGKKAFEEKRLLTAENHFRKAYEILPDSLSVIIFLAGVHFAFEENEKSMVFYEEALHLAPDFREALLGKAICLGYMRKHEYAILVLNELLELGRYYMGETYFWLAWNQNELELIEEAQKNVNKTENYLVGQVEVLVLQGKIAFKLGRKDESEEYFNQALTLQRDHCEAEFYLAKIQALREDWENTGIHYEKAAYCYKNQEAALASRIKEIEESPMSVERKARLILKIKAQLRKTALTKATCFYNGAAGYFNCGQINKALVIASYAAKEDAFAAKAEELIKKFINK